MKRICLEHSLSAPEPLSNWDMSQQTPSNTFREPNTSSSLTLPLASADTYHVIFPCLYPAATRGSFLPKPALPFGPDAPLFQLLAEVVFVYPSSQSREAPRQNPNTRGLWETLFWGILSAWDGDFSKCTGVIQNCVSKNKILDYFF